MTPRIHKIEGIQIHMIEIRIVAQTRPIVINTDCTMIRIASLTCRHRHEVYHIEIRSRLHDKAQKFQDKNLQH